MATNRSIVSPASLPRSPDTSSPSAAYSDRPIRPLPKRRIRSRLSEEQADSIIFPPVVAASSPLFGAPQTQVDRPFGISHIVGDGTQLHSDRDHDHFCECGEPQSTIDSDEDEDEQEESDHPTAADHYSWPERTMKYPRRYEARPPRQLKSPPLNSSTSSADGYESFENTNNKKKRKIPVSGAPGQALSSDITGMSVPTQSVDVSSVDDLSPSGPHPAVGSGIGISGPGRGRYSRSTVRPLSERRPLSTTPNAVNAFSGISNSAPDKGIISTAIANATETSHVPAPKGQENVSLLQRQKQSNTVPQNFTFEYKSAISDKLASARPNAPSAMLPKAPPLLKTPGISNAKQPPPPPLPPNGAAQSQQPPRGPAPSSVPAPNQASQPAQQPAAKNNKPRRPGQALRMAAFRRKEQQRYENYVNPPKAEDTWICEFCEYESIFGQEPLALVRAYEQRERRERKERETNRKRLEQAKAKGRKGKKGKASQKHAANNASNNPSAQNQRYDPRYDGTQEGDSQGEEFFDDDYEESLPGLSPIEQESGAYSSHEYPPPPPPPPPIIETVENRPPVKPSLSPLSKA